jgi:hypothetical protein
VPRLKGMPTPTPRPIRRILALTLALAGILAAFLIAAPGTRAVTTSPTYKGTGWTAWTSNGIYSLSPGPYTIVFANSTARTRLSPYLTGPAGQVTASVGVPVTVTTLLDSTPVTSCPAKHRIIVHYTYRPMGVKGMSQTRACHGTADGSAWSAHISIDTEYWSTSSWFSTNATTNSGYRRDTVAHELGHALGLDHPNTDLNKNGVVSSGECVKNTAGVKPVMCSTNRGSIPSTVAGRYTSEFDLPGLRQMAANYYLRQAS